MKFALVSNVEVHTWVKGIAHSPLPTLNDAILVRTTSVHPPNLWTVGFLLLIRTLAELLHKETLSEEALSNITATEGPYVHGYNVSRDNESELF